MIANLAKNLASAFLTFFPGLHNKSNSRLLCIRKSRCNVLSIGLKFFTTALRIRNNPSRHRSFSGRAESFRQFCRRTSWRCVYSCQNAYCYFRYQQNPIDHSRTAELQTSTEKRWRELASNWKERDRKVEVSFNWTFEKKTATASHRYDFRGSCKLCRITKRVSVAALGGFTVI